jgi:hypothetical protein
MDLGVAHRDTERFVSTTATLTLRDRTTRVNIAAGADAFTVTLPPVGPAQGLTFAVTAILAGATGICTVSGAGDEETAIAHQLDTTLDHVVVSSDGVRWHTTVNGIA